MTDIAPLLDQARALAGRYIADLDARGVMPTEAALARLAELQRPLPEGPTDPAHVLAELDRVGSPATVATTGGRYFGFVVGGALPVTVAASWLASAWDQNAGTWILAPGAAELEVVAAEWLLDIFDLPRDATVGFVTGSTMGAFAAFAAARSALLRRAGWDVKRKGMNGAPPLRIVTGAELHPDQPRCARLREIWAGLGRARTRRRAGSAACRSAAAARRSHDGDPASG